MRYTFLRFPEFRRKALTLSYDDGVVFDEKLIEIMSKNGVKGTFNVNSGMFSNAKNRRMSKEQAVKLYTESGNEVAIHGKKHLSLAEVSPAIATDEVLGDRIALEEAFGCIVEGMAYANGSYDDNVVEILKKCGVKYARTIISTEKFDIPDDWLRLPATCHHNNPRLMELARSFVEEEAHSYYWLASPKLFYLWGHSYEFNDNNNWEVIEEFLEYMGNRQDIWYATNMEIYNYVQAFKSLEFSVNASLVHNPTSTDVYINYLGKDIKVSAGETVLL